MTASTIELLAFVQTIILSIALPLSTIAAYGSRGTQWGGVVAPLPVIELSFIIGIAMGLLDYDTGTLLLVQAVVFSVGVVGTTIVAIRLMKLATGGIRA